MHGAPLPKPGSFQERLLTEAVIRERNERMAMVTVIVRMLELVGNVDHKAVTQLLEEYKEELYQFRYNYKYETYSLRSARDRMRHMLETNRMMQRLDAMTVEDSDIKPRKED